jgi:choline dehydrogenase
MKLLPLLALPLTVLASPFYSRCNVDTPGANSTNTYDYIVVGSGPGGGTIATNLALAGYHVLLVEAGDDQSSAITTQILNLFSFGTPTSWDFFVRHTDDLERTKRYNLLTWRLKSGQYFVGRNPPESDAEMLGVYYPRGSTLGGSAIVNAGCTLLPSDSDWDVFSNETGDGLWKGKEMRKYFERIEHNEYLPPGTPGHGFTGWLPTIIASRSIYLRNIRLTVIQAGLKLLGLDPSKVFDYVVGDANFEDPKRDYTEGVWALPFHANKIYKRFSPRDRILAARAEKTANGTRKYKLDLQLSSLATKVLFEEDCSKGNGKKKPKAIGVEWLEGTAVYKADPRWNSTIKGKPGRAFARKEVIVAGGAFSTPQLLQLSGIGDKALLKQFNISVISDLPGVGRNLQDNYELPIIGHANVSLVTPPDPNAPACMFGAPNDPCVELWRNNGTGPYSQGGDNGFAFIIKTNHTPDGERDVLMFSGAGPLRGFTPPSAGWMDVNPPTTFAHSTVKIHPQNTAGFVKIKSGDPIERPDINMNLFVEGADTDIGAFLDTIAWARRGFRATGGSVGPLTPAEPPCPPSLIDEEGYCKDPEIDRQWIEDQVFGHHPTSTAAVGGDNNTMAVLDTRLRVRGVKGLRVVDASAFPRVPGAFPALATFMLSERATELVLEDV